MNFNKTKLFTAILVLVHSPMVLAGVSVSKVNSDLTKPPIQEDLWKGVKEEVVPLMAQPMAVPRPKMTSTASVRVQAIHNGKWIAFRLRWTDPEKDEAGKLGKFSDAVAIQFPAKNNGTPPPVFMGAKDQPVHIMHWRAQYQADQERGSMPTVKDIYPNSNPDIYPMEFADHGNIKGITEEKREIYVHGRAAGNPQSYLKKSSVDEILATGFGTSAVLEASEAVAKGTWQKGEWSVVISRPLVRENASTIDTAKGSFMAFAVWQGSKDEVGGRKSVTMSWVPLEFSEKL